jgi:hypothetical protein
VVEVEILPPLREWGLPGLQKVMARMTGYVALKRRDRDWDGYADAVLAETADTDWHMLPGGYLAVPEAALPGIMARLGDNAARVIVRRVKSPAPVAPAGGPSGRYEIAGAPWRDNDGVSWWFDKRRRESR